MCFSFASDATDYNLSRSNNPHSLSLSGRRAAVFFGVDLPHNSEGQLRERMTPEAEDSNIDAPRVAILIP
jgi:hypothetical protein